MIAQLPEGLTQSGQSGVFKSGSVPDAILNWHTTKAGVWGKIVIYQGSAIYEILTDPVEKIELDQTVCGLIEPEQPHRLTPAENTEFQILFYKFPKQAS